MFLEGRITCFSLLGTFQRLNPITFRLLGDFHVSARSWVRPPPPPLPPWEARFGGFLTDPC